jgi:hypothetical protein
MMKMFDFGSPLGGHPRRLVGLLGLVLSSLALLVLAPAESWARGDHGGGGRGVRSVQATAPSSVRASRTTSVSASRSTGGSRNLNATQNVNANRNVNVNKDVNVNRNVNVNRDVDVHHHYGGDYHNDWDNAGAFVAGAVVGGITGAAIASASQPNTVVVTPGTIVTTLPSGCTTAIINGISYHQCGGVYYRPQYSGTSVVYVVATP